MEALEELRKQLDEIDDQLVKLYEDRMRICALVGKYKIKNGRKVMDRQREREKLQDVESKVSLEYNKKGIRKLYKQLMSMSRRLQYRQFAQAFLCVNIFGRKRG
ncbi:MAG: chorismate mutase [Lachnospiraceae bacterium]|nr:chorismate mutase [Lachnospiraceae bacterium]